MKQPYRPSAGPGPWRSERQRRYTFTKHPRAAHKLSHGVPTTKRDWSRPYGPSYRASKDPAVRKPARRRKKR